MATIDGIESRGTIDYTNGYIPFSAITTGTEGKTTPTDGEDEPTPTTIIYYMKVTGLYSNENEQQSSLNFIQKNSEFYIEIETNIANINSCAIKMETDIGDFAVFALPEETLTQNTKRIKCILKNELKAFNNNIYVYAISTTENGIEYILPTTDVENVEPERYKYEHYIPPFSFTIVDYRFDKCNEQYEIITDGPFIFVSKLKIKFISGCINKISSIEITRVGGNEGIDIVYSSGSGGEHTFEQMTGKIQDIFNGIIYIDSQEFYLFEDINKENQEIDGSYTILGTADSTINIRITLNDHGIIETDEENDLIVSNAYDVLTLVGETLLDNGQKIYGGIAIGMRTTVKEKGQPVFECAYPAYFNGHALGFFPGSLLIFDQDTIFSGLINSNYTRFTIFLGEPIYASSIEIEGSLRILGHSSLSSGGYRLYPETYTAAANKISVTNINNQAGVINIKILHSTNSVHFITGAGIIVPESNFKLTFK